MAVATWVLAWLAGNWSWLGSIGVMGFGNWVRTRVRQWMSGPLAIATALLALVIVAVIAVHLLRAAVVSDAVAAKDAAWRAGNAYARIEQMRRQRSRDTAATVAADRARKALEDELQAAKTRASALEQELAKAASQSGDPDPVIWSREITRRLRQ